LISFILRIWISLFPSIFLFSCTAGDEGPKPPDTDPPHITISTPLPGATVADTVDIRAECEDNTAVVRLTWLVDGAPLSIQYMPPWALTWAIPDQYDNHVVTLTAEAVDGAGNITITPGQALNIVENRPPNIRILWPPDQVRLDLDSTEHPWRCHATDPDEGSEFTAPILWQVEGATLSGTGAIRQPPALSPGTFTISAAVTDRWGRSARAEHTVHVFEYPDPITAEPKTATTSLLLALQARDEAVVGEMLATSFRLIRPGGENLPVETGREAFLELLHHLFGDSTLRQISFRGTVDGPVRFSQPDCHWAMISLRNVKIRHCTGRMGNLYSTEGVDCLLTDHSAARLFWRQAPGALEWKLYSWWDLHDSYPAATAGPSWSQLLSRYGGSILD
jgi:Bacterial Ig domain